MAVTGWGPLPWPVMTADIDNTETTGRPDRRAHRSTYLGGRPQRIEGVTGNERRRRWSAKDKQAIVVETLEPDVSIAGVARKPEIGTAQLHGWPHQFLTSRRGKAASFRPGWIRCATRTVARRSHGAGGCAGGRPGAAPRARGAARAIGRTPGVPVWLAWRRTDMRTGMDCLAMLAHQPQPGCNPKPAVTLPSRITPGQDHKSPRQGHVIRGSRSRMKVTEQSQYRWSADNQEDCRHNEYHHGYRHERWQLICALFQPD